MLRVHIHSRSGNVVLALVGLSYAAIAVALFAWHASHGWGMAGLLDRVTPLLLVMSAAGGLWLAYNSMQNLRGRKPAPLATRATSHRSDSSVGFAR